MKTINILCLLLLCSGARAQQWVDTTYREITTMAGIEYGDAVDFKGADEVLRLDVAMPANDTPPACGRPLMVIIHGGAFYTGDKQAIMPSRLRHTFARRGYVTASVDYRLGMFNTDQELECEALRGWKCWNMADTSEWYRAYYRGVQDVHGAIRHLVNERETYDINPDNIFVVGLSAGGFVAMGVGYTDEEGELLLEHVSDLDRVEEPHNTYELDCVRRFGLADRISEYELRRPDLGPWEGELNTDVSSDYRIRGVGSLYGGAFNDIFETRSGQEAPALYLYHQPCDLVVPYRRNQLAAGYNHCAMGDSTMCPSVINRPYLYGGGGIADLIDAHEAAGRPTCDYLLDRTEHFFDCDQQAMGGANVCHRLDNFWLRTNTMAAYFADQIAECGPVAVAEPAESNLMVYPNPARGELYLKLGEDMRAGRVELCDLMGRVVLVQELSGQAEQRIDVRGLAGGCYLLRVGIADRPQAVEVVVLTP